MSDLFPLLKGTNVERDLFQAVITSMTDEELSELSVRIVDEKMSRARAKIDRGEAIPLDENEIDLASSGRRLDAIKRYHRRTNASILLGKLLVSDIPGRSKDRSN